MTCQIFPKVKKKSICVFSCCHSKLTADEYPIKIFKTKEKSMITNEFTTCMTTVELNTMLEAHNINDAINQESGGKCFKNPTSLK